MNVQLKDITVTARDGRVSHLDQVYIRGSHVRFFIVPDMLRYFHPPFALPDSALCRVPSMAIMITTVLTATGTPRCSALEASAVVVSVWRVERRRCSGREDRDGVEALGFSFSSRLFVNGFAWVKFYTLYDVVNLCSA
jgi:hypothetical protein